MTLLRPLALAAALLLPAAAMAAPVPLFTATGTALFDGQFADFFDGDGDDIDISVTAEWVAGTLTGSLLVSDLGGILLESDEIFDALIDLQPGSDTATLVFRNFAGSAAGGMRSLAAVFTFSLEDQDNGVFDPVGVAIYAAPVPVPASLGLLLLGLGAVAGLSRRRRA